jgi:transposase
MGPHTDLVRNSLPAAEQVVLEAVEETAEGIVFRVRGRHTPRCPACFQSPVSYHSRYLRRMGDLPWQGKRVEIHWETRRFRCRNRECERKIFAEPLPGLAAPKARETIRLCEVVGVAGYALGCLPGQRLLHRLGINRSDDTVLRRVKLRIRDANQPKVRVLGVDDWAWRKRQRYGAILMDLEQSRIVDLLPVRSAESLAAWLRLHPEVEVITRDRSSLYAEEGGRGRRPPFKSPIVYHLVSNLSEAMERDIQQLQIEARGKLAETVSGRTTEPKKPRGSKRGGGDAGKGDMRNTWRCLNYAGKATLSYLSRRKWGSAQRPFPDG